MPDADVRSRHPDAPSPLRRRSVAAPSPLRRRSVATASTGAPYREGARPGREGTVVGARGPRAGPEMHVGPGGEQARGTRTASTRRRPVRRALGAVTGETRGRARGGAQGERRRRARGGRGERARLLGDPVELPRGEAAGRLARRAGWTRQPCRTCWVCASPRDRGEKPRVVRSWRRGHGCTPRQAATWPRHGVEPLGPGTGSSAWVRARGRATGSGHGVRTMWAQYGGGSSVWSPVVPGFGSRCS